MTTKELQQIIIAGESAKVDFKREWYKKEDLKGELIKDMLALANGDTNSIDQIAYLIIGIQDNTKKLYKFDTSTLIPLDRLKKEILQNLNNYSHSPFTSLEIEWVEYQDGAVLVLSSTPFYRLISLAKDLILKNGTDKKGIVYYRIGESISVASPDVMKDFERVFNQDNGQNGMTINQTINIYNTKQDKTKERTEPNIEDSTFTTTTLQYLSREQIVVLLSQDFTDISNSLKSIKSKVADRYDNTYYFELEKSYKNQKEFTKHLSKSCQIDAIKRLNDFKHFMDKKLQSSHKNILFFVTEFENMDSDYIKEFTSIIRDLKSNPNFFAILVGKKKLASMIYGEGNLSPLNNVKEIFFPQTIDDDIDIINRQFTQLNRFEKQIKKYLLIDDLGLASTWSNNETLKELFWKNLIIKKDNRFVWRSKFTVEMGLERYND